MSVQTTQVTGQGTARYEWGKGVSHPVSPQVVGETISALEERHGVCAPGTLVEEARTEDSPLHPLFTWDDGVAAEKYRRVEARAVIRSVRVVVAPTAPSQIAFASIRTVYEGASVRGYANTARITADELLHRQVLKEALTQLQGLRARYSELSELQTLWQALDEVAS